MKKKRKEKNKTHVGVIYKLFFILLDLFMGDAGETERGGEADVG